MSADASTQRRQLQQCLSSSGPLAYQTLLKSRKDHAKLRTPNKHTDRVAWNNHLETEISLNYALFAFPGAVHPIEKRPDLQGSWEDLDIPHTNQTITHRNQHLMDAEGRLIARAVEDLVYGTFEADWNGLELEEKKKITFEGLYRGACTCTRDSSRDICPEMTIGGLIGDGEYNLINLLQAIVKHDPTGNGSVKQPFFFVHPHVEQEYHCTDEAPDRLKAFLYLVVLHRNSFIVSTLIGILGAFHNHPFKPNSAAKSAPGPADRAERTQKARLLVKKSGIRVDMAQSQCSALKQCGRCKNSWYCSVDCQKSDWKFHQRFCGKADFDPKVLIPTYEGPAEFIGRPAVIPGFTHDYHFVTAVGSTRSLRIEYPPGAKLVFLVARRRAMAAGSLAAIYMMLKILEYHEPPAEFDLTIEQIRRQLEKEYNVTLSDVGPQAERAFKPPTAQEVEEEKIHHHAPFP
ncbi:hypothetical protein DFH09DRAFT_1311696 [Mycena vulgaris]|nr:hypothetical protein DFH09DRAFT_1311696 [Mycena vulgaris]